ncbi:UDP-glucose 4-epimerase [Pullulanibacillus camelliae]|uniref:UDP-glucose 4-epimerase n=1 Tax=Pullulanibacillus camelliae TaxID=1707096 RepID=A0A8J2YE16_9BACL|nr:NAD(P)-dependent oxidoreductase [Pullulanibacillus camelliae]GGE41614.1 UDP-glucose 4-epimerase [Pullulanibacillus camelliae]
MILVTGAAGYIGSFFIHYLKKKNKHIQLRAVDSFEGGQLQRVGDVPVEKVDLTNREEVEPLMKDITVVVHCAAMSAIPDCETYSQRAILTNVLTVYNLLEEGSKHKLKKIIFPSSFAVYAPNQAHISEQSQVSPYNFYGHLKQWGEQLILAYHKQANIDYVIFRQTNVCGKGLVEKGTVLQLMCQAIKKDKPLTVFGSGKQMRNFIHINDVVRYYEEALTSHTGIYNLGGPESLSIKDLAHRMTWVAKKQLNKEVEVVFQPSDREGKELTTPNFFCDISKLTKDFRRAPSYGVNEMIGDMLLDQKR